MNDFTAKTWANKKKQKRLELIRPGYYRNNAKNGEKGLYLHYFRLENFKSLDSNERNRHKLRECTECMSDRHWPAYSLRRAHKRQTDAAADSLQNALKKTPVTPKECEAFVKEVVNQADPVLAASETPKSVREYLKRKATDPADVSKSAKRKIIQRERDVLQTKLKDKDFAALYSSAQSETEYAAHRKAAYGEYRTSKPRRSHVAKLESYSYNRGDLMLKLAETNDFTSINYTEWARSVELSRKGVFPKNAGQVS